MRQAYDYWQNQPGNYRPRARREASPCPSKRAESVKRWGACAPGEPSVIRTQSNCPRTGHPFATSGFSKTRVRRRDQWGSLGLGHVGLRRRLPVAGHARRRLPIHERSPDCVNSNVNHRSTTHRLPQRGITLIKKNTGFGGSPHHSQGSARTPTAEGQARGGTASRPHPS